METAVAEKTGELMSLQPTPESRVALVKEGKMDEVGVLDKQAEVVGNKLDIGRIKAPITREETLAMMDFIVEIGDIKLFELAKVRLAYDNAVMPVLTIKEKEKYADVFRNAAVSLREEAVRKEKEGQKEQAKANMTEAEKYYDLYLQEKGLAPSNSNKALQFESRGNLNQKMISSDFPKNIGEADIAWADLSSKIIKGKKVPNEFADVLEKVDGGWLRVWYYLSPEKEKFPKAYEAVKNLDNYVAGKFGIPVEKLLEYHGVRNSGSKEMTPVL